jgi:hypothetical protein
LCGTFGCSGFRSALSSGDGALSVFDYKGILPDSDRLDQNCMLNPAYDGCIYLKNPAAQDGRAIAPSDLTNHRRFGIKLAGLDGSGYLQNAFIQVQSTNWTRWQVNDHSGYKAALGDGQSYTEQISAYYWADRAAEYLTSRLTAARVPISGLLIYADDAFTGYSSQHGSIHLEKNPGKVSRALSGEIVIQLFGQAIAQNLSGGKLLQTGSGSQHNFCELNPKGCCKTDSGCPAAIVSGFGDYVAAVLNPAAPRLGETLASNLAGQPICGLNRDLKTLATSSKVAVFSACAAAQGQVTLMGSWYASLWWNLRVKAEARESGSSLDIDILFFDHVKTLDANSTFANAKSAALTLAQAYKSGKYVSLMQTALAEL